MKKRFIVAGLFSVLFIFVLLLAACDNSTGRSFGGVAKTIKINNFPGYSYNGKMAMLTLHSSLTSTKITAVGALMVSGSPSTLTFSLKTDEYLNNNWTGSGNYYLMISIFNTVTEKLEKVFLYNSGLYSINQPTSTISFDLFANVPLTSIKTMPSFESIKEALVP